MDEKRFYDNIRQNVFSGRISDEAFQGLKTLLAAWDDEYAEYPDQFLAYCLATAFHETGGTMQPVREGFASSDERARSIVAGMFRRGRIKRNYAAPHPVTGHSYYGRGYVQLTWSYNYRKAGAELGMKLFENPDKVMQPEIAARILYSGCIEGWFTSKKLGDYISENRCNYRSARRVVNGLDKASLIAGYANKFESAIKEATGPEVITARKLEKAGSRTAKAVRRNNDSGVAVIGVGVAGGTAEALKKLKDLTDSASGWRTALDSLIDTFSWVADYWYVGVAAAGGVFLWNNRKIIRARIDDEVRIRRLSDD